VPEDGSVADRPNASIASDAPDDLAQASVPSGAPPTQAQPGPVPWVQAIGAATAFVAVGLGLVYGLGAVSIGLRLWYIEDPVTPVLGQLPSAFLLVDAFSELILPAIAVGAAAYFVLELLLKASWRQALTAGEGHPRRHFFMIFPAMVLALAPLGFLQLSYRWPCQPDSAPPSTLIWRHRTAAGA
jgi:hypothetical protein